MGFLIGDMVLFSRIYIHSLMGFRLYCYETCALDWVISLFGLDIIKVNRIYKFINTKLRIIVIENSLIRV